MIVCCFGRVHLNLICRCPSKHVKQYNDYSLSMLGFHGNLLQHSWAEFVQIFSACSVSCLMAIRTPVTFKNSKFIATLSSPKQRKLLRAVMFLTLLQQIHLRVCHSLKDNKGTSATMFRTRQQNRNLWEKVKQGPIYVVQVAACFPVFQTLGQRECNLDCMELSTHTKNVGRPNS